MNLRGLQKPFLPLKTFIPGFASLTLLTIKNLLQNIFLQTEIGNKETNYAQVFIQNETKSSAHGVLENMFENYATFLLLTLLFDILLQGFTLLRRRTSNQGKTESDLWRRMNLSRNQQLSFDLIKMIIKYLSTSLVKWTLIFGFFKALWIWISINRSNISLQASIQGVLTETQFQQALIPSRVLEEGQSVFTEFSHDTEKLWEFQKPSLTIGEVMSQFDIEVQSMKLSKDEKTAYVVTNFPATLKIIDISDLEYPVIRSSLSLPSGRYSFLFRSVIVSDNEDLLYISNIQSLEIINISDLRNPYYLKFLEDHNMIQKGQDFGSLDISKPTLSISQDKRVLFVAGIGLQIFDISIPKSPVLMNSMPSQAKLPASLAIDGDKLFYSDGSLWIYNVSDPMNMQLISCFNETYPITSMILSKNSTTAFALTTDKNKNTYVKKLKISDDAKMIKIDRNIQLAKKSQKPPIFLEQTPRDLFLLILASASEGEYQRRFFVFDNIKESLLSHKKMIIKSGFSIVFTKNYEKALVGSNFNLTLASLYLNYPNKNAFTRSSNILKSFKPGVRYISFDSDDRIIYSLSLGEQRKNIFGIQKSKGAEFVNLSFFNAETTIDHMVMSGDKTRAFLIAPNKIIILGISDSMKITLLGEYTDSEQMKAFITSRDGKTGYLVEGSFDDTFLTIVDFSDPQKPVKKSSSLQSPHFGMLSVLILSKDEKKLFLVRSKLWVYDVSNATLPFILDQTSISTGEDTLGLSVTEGLLSHDGNTLFIKEGSSKNYGTIHIVDVANITKKSPKAMSEFHYVFKSLDYYYFGRTFRLSPDSNTLYMMRSSHLMVIDVANKTSPRFLGEIQIFNGSSPDVAMDFILSEDGTKAYVSTSYAKFHVVSLQPSYTTFVKQDTLTLGEKHSQDVVVLKTDENRNYNVLEVDYRFTKCALVEPISMHNANFEDVVLKTTPSWMTFDLKSQTFIVEARRKNDIGSYRVYFGFSKQLEVNMFSVINDTLNSNDLMTTLISLGYVDNELFLTLFHGTSKYFYEFYEKKSDDSQPCLFFAIYGLGKELTEKFGLEKYFLLPSQYSLIIKRVYEMLKEYSFETFNEINVVKSIEISHDDDHGKLKIHTANPSSLKVDIILTPEHPKQAQFLSRYYGYLFPSITVNKSRITLEGSMAEINLALQEVVVNLENITSCDGHIIVDDKLNPILNESIGEITKFFNLNIEPELSNNSIVGTLQNQISKSPVWTGEYFQIKLSQNTFYDKYTFVENLNYHVVFVENGEETNVLPNWVSLSGMDLIGTAPESVFGRNYEFKLIVKNEFREYKEPFVLHVKISIGFVLRLLIKYSPYILSIVGLWVSANKIFNIVFKGRYKHPKDFEVRVGEEIRDEVIFPISFIGEEMEEAKRILKIVKKKVAKEYGVGAWITESQLLDYFERKIDKWKVCEVIKEGLIELTEEKRQEFERYFSGEDSLPQKIIHEIIVNNLTLSLLDTNEGKETKIYFEKLKKNWPMFVEWDTSVSSFKICEDKFNQIVFTEDEETKLTSSASFFDPSEPFVEKINHELLKMAILAHAFFCQNINIFPEDVELRVKEKRRANFIKRFLKRDLKSSTLAEKGKIGYGIGYTKEYNTLYFHGVVKPDIKNKIIVVQIANLKHKILKELWIYGEKTGSHIVKSEKVENKREQLEDSEISYQVL